MNIKFQNALLFVKDIKASRVFYEKVMKQRVEYDFEEDVVFKGGFAIHDANHISNLLFQRQNPNIEDKLGQENFELYFECDDLDQSFSQITESGAKIIHPLIEQPWGQKVFRFYDPDFHIIEIGEPMAAVLKRYIKAGLSDVEISKRTSMPVEEVQKTRSDIA